MKYILAICVGLLSAVSVNYVPRGHIPLLADKVTIGDGPDRPNDIIRSNFFRTVIERGPVKTHDCTTYKPSPDGAMIYVECPKK